MAITLGTNGYISVADFKAWADARGYDYLSFLDSEIENAITISGVDFLDVNYTFKGDSVSDTQPMQLPTDEVTIANIANAAAQATWQQLQGRLFVALTDTSTQGDIKRKKDKVGTLEQEIEYTDGTARTYTYPTPIIDKLLAKYVIGGGNPRILRA